MSSRVPAAPHHAVRSAVSELASARSGRPSRRTHRRGTRPGRGVVPTTVSARAGRHVDALCGRESERGHGDRGRDSALRTDVFAYGVRADDWTHRENGAGEEGNRAGARGSAR